MTSGNLSEEPIARDNEEALARLKNIADCFLVHNRGIYARYDDSVYIVTEGKPSAVRRARGYAPYPIMLPYKSTQILACGAELKILFASHEITMHLSASTLAIWKTKRHSDTTRIR